MFFFLVAVCGQDLGTLALFQSKMFCGFPHSILDLGRGPG